MGGKFPFGGEDRNRSKVDGQFSKACWSKPGCHHFGQVPGVSPPGTGTLADLLVTFNKGFLGGGRRAQRNIGNSKWPETNRKKDVPFLEQRAGRDPVRNGIRSK
jgi:hypothetical protein